MRQRGPGPAPAPAPADPERAASVRAIAEQLEQPARAAPADPPRGRGGLGYVDRDDVVVIADVLNLSRADVHGVVTFYHDFRRTPPAAHRVAALPAEACQAVGAEALVAARRRDRWAASAPTSRSAEVFCLGNCALGPSGTVDGAAARPGRRRAARRASTDRVAAMTTVYVPATPPPSRVGADEVAAAIAAAGRHGRPQRLARHALARAARRGRDRARPGRLRPRHRGRRRRRCSTAAARRHRPRCIGVVDEHAVAGPPAAA